MRLFRNRSQMTSKCGKNKKVAHEAIAECVTEPFDVIHCLYKMKQSHWLLCVAKNCDWSRKITLLSRLNRAVGYRGMTLKTYCESRIELWNLQILKKMLEKPSQFFVIRAALWAEKLGRCLEYCRSWKNTLGKVLAVAVNTGGHSIRVIQELWMKRALVVTVEICFLWAVVGDSQISLILVSDTPYSCDTVGREL